MKIKSYCFTCLSALLLLFACTKPNNYSSFEAEITREQVVNISSDNENHVIPGIVQLSKLHLRFYSDNSIIFDVLLDSIQKAGDAAHTIQINLGDPVSDGPLLIDLTPGLSGAYAFGVVKGIRQGLMDTLLNDNIDKYINVISANAPTGLLRGQLNSDIVIAKNVELSGDNVVPAVNTATKGIAFLRATANRKLYSKIIVSNNDPADPVTGATINEGSTVAGGAVIATLANTAADFGNGQTTALSEAGFNTLLQNSSYVSVSSPLYITGKLNGRVK